MIADFSVDDEVLHQLPLERVDTHERVDSTNSEALRLLRQGQTCPFLVLASQQTDGRGRRGRRWESPPGAGLYYTLAVEVHQDMQNVAALSLVTALSVCSALEQMGVHALELKWPNDVLGDARKLCGILLESLKIKDRFFIVIGAGVIGCEYASIFRGLGVKTDLINTRDRLLSFLDNEVSDALSYHFWNSGVVIRNDETYEKIEGTEDGVIIHLESGKKMRADCILYANGRTGNTDKLNLSAVGLNADSRGQLTVDSNYQTEVDHIYAVGDVIGYPSLASAAYDQGRYVAQAINKGQADGNLIEDIPTGIYTIPEISSVGKTEQELTAAKVPYEVGRSSFKHLARAQIAGKDIGSLKILFHRETKEILGIHCFGERAAEIIHIGQAIMEQKGKANTIEYFVNTTFNYPTMAEAYRVAALNGLNRLF